MFCPHCGTENDEDNRFCVNCGSELSSSGSGQSGGGTRKERLVRLVGSDRRARVATLVTVLAIVVAFVAFLSLGSSDSSESTYLQSLDRACVTEKERVIALEQETLRQHPPNLGEFASVLVTIVAEWRTGLRSEPAPADYAGGVAAYEASLLRILIGAGGLARLTREDASAAAIAAQAKIVDEGTAQADDAIEKLGLTECTELTVAPGTSG
jgi:hypothetical protein